MLRWLQRSREAQRWAQAHAGRLIRGLGDNGGAAVRAGGDGWPNKGALAAGGTAVARKTGKPIGLDTATTMID